MFVHRLKYVFLFFVACRGLFRTVVCFIPGHALYQKGLQKKQKKRRFTVQQPRLKSASCHILKLRVNRGSTAGFVPPSVYIKFIFFVSLGKQDDVSSMLWSVRVKLVSWANNSVGTQPCPTPPHQSAVRSVPTRQWYVRVLDSTGVEVKRTISFWTIRRVGICYCKAWPHPALEPRAALNHVPPPPEPLPTKTACGMFGFSTPPVPRHPWDEKGLQRQRRVDL